MNISTKTNNVYMGYIVYTMHLCVYCLLYMDIYIYIYHDCFVYHVSCVHTCIFPIHMIIYICIMFIAFISIMLIVFVPILYTVYVMDIMHIMSIVCGLYMSNFLYVMYGCVVGCMSYMSYKTNIPGGNQTWQ